MSSTATSSPLDGIKEKINSIVEKYPIIDGIFSKGSEKLKVDKAFLVLGFLILIPITLFSFLTGGSFVIDLIGFLYPMYASIKAIESTGSDDDTVWLTYWLVFSVFKIFEEVGDFILNYIPFYRLLKATFLVWCFYPKTQGARVIYTSFIQPYIVPALGINILADGKKDD